MSEPSSPVIPQSGRLDYPSYTRSQKKSSDSNKVAAAVKRFETQSTVPPAQQTRSKLTHFTTKRSPSLQNASSSPKLGQHSTLPSYRPAEQERPITSFSTLPQTITERGKLFENQHNQLKDSERMKGDPNKWTSRFKAPNQTTTTSSLDYARMPSSSLDPTPPSPYLQDTFTLSSPDTPPAPSFPPTTTVSSLARDFDARTKEPQPPPIRRTGKRWAPPTKSSPSDQTLSQPLSGIQRPSRSLSTGDASPKKSIKALDPNRKAFLSDPKDPASKAQPPRRPLKKPVSLQPGGTARMVENYGTDIEAIKKQLQKSKDSTGSLKQNVKKLNIDPNTKIIQSGRPKATPNKLTLPVPAASPIEDSTFVFEQESLFEVTIKGNEIIAVRKRDRQEFVINIFQQNKNVTLDAIRTDRAKLKELSEQICTLLEDEHLLNGKEATATVSSGIINLAGEKGTPKSLLTDDYNDLIDAVNIMGDQIQVIARYSKETAGSLIEVTGKGDCLPASLIHQFLDPSSSGDRIEQAKKQATELREDIKNELQKESGWRTSIINRIFDEHELNLTFQKTFVAIKNHPQFNYAEQASKRGLKEYTFEDEVITKDDIKTLLEIYSEYVGFNCNPRTYLDDFFVYLTVDLVNNAKNPKKAFQVVIVYDNPKGPGYSIYRVVNPSNRKISTTDFDNVFFVYKAPGEHYKSTAFNSKVKQNLLITYQNAFIDNYVDNLLADLNRIQKHQVNGMINSISALEVKHPKAYAALQAELCKEFDNINERTFLFDLRKELNNLFNPDVELQTSPLIIALRKTLPTLKNKPLVT